jgi:hypothetical protein|tara:strand:+ start:270 stop:515 length:246 start_codon:yes stop_codon:yes gene_type:complete
MSNPFTRRGKEPNYTTENFSVRDVKRANARFYEKFPEAIEPAAMIKKAMQDPGDEVVKEQTRRENEMENFVKSINITGGIY